MALKVEVDHPGFVKGYELAIPGVGMVGNGSSVTLTEEQETLFYSVTGQKVRDYYKDDGNVKVTGSSDAKIASDTGTAVSNEGSDS